MINLTNATIVSSKGAKVQVQFEYRGWTYQAWVASRSYHEDTAEVSDTVFRKMSADENRTECNFTVEDVKAYIDEKAANSGYFHWGSEYDLPEYMEDEIQAYYDAVDARKTAGILADKAAEEAAAKAEFEANMAAARLRWGINENMTADEIAEALGTVFGPRKISRKRNYYREAEIAREARKDEYLIAIIEAVGLSTYNGKLYDWSDKSEVSDEEWSAYQFEKEAAADARYRTDLADKIATAIEFVESKFDLDEVKRERMIRQIENCKSFEELAELGF